MVPIVNCIGKISRFFGQPGSLVYFRLLRNFRNFDLWWPLLTSRVIFRKFEVISSELEFDKLSFSDNFNFRFKNSTISGQWISPITSGRTGFYRQIFDIFEGKFQATDRPIFSLFEPQLQKWPLVTFFLISMTHMSHHDVTNRKRLIRSRTP